jgi:hypothetical protein
MFRLLAGAFALCVLAASVSAEDKKEPGVTIWEHEANGLDLRIEMGKGDTMKAAVFSGENGVIATCKIKKEKDGTIKATVTDVQEKGNFPAKPKVGLEFSFKWKVKDDVATLSDLEGEGLNDVKGTVEGEYKKK